MKKRRILIPALLALLSQVSFATSVASPSEMITGKWITKPRVDKRGVPTQYMYDFTKSGEYRLVMFCRLSDVAHGNLMKWPVDLITEVNGEWSVDNIESTLRIGSHGKSLAQTEGIPYGKLEHRFCGISESEDGYGPYRFSINKDNQLELFLPGENAPVGVLDFYPY